MWELNQSSLEHSSARKAEAMIRTAAILEISWANLRRQPVVCTEFIRAAWRTDDALIHYTLNVD